MTTKKQGEMDVGKCSHRMEHLGTDWFMMELNPYNGFLQSLNITAMGPPNLHF